MRTAILAALLLIPLVDFSHGGGLNAEGSHSNRGTGDYHCHRPPSIQRSPQRPSMSPTIPRRPRKGARRRPLGAMPPAATSVLAAGHAPSRPAGERTTTGARAR